MVYSISLERWDIIMILLNVGHISGLSSAIALRYTRYSKESCCLLITDSNPEIYNHNLEKNNVFDKVISMVDYPGPYPQNDIELEQNIVKFYDKFFLDNELDLTSVIEFNCCADLHNWFALYLSLKKIYYSIYELWPLQLYDREKSKFIFGRIKPLQLKYMSLSGENKYCTKRYLHPNGNIPKPEKDEIVDFYNLIFEISHEQKLKIIKSFDIESISNKSLILFTSTSSTSTITNIDIKDPYYPYKIISDLILSENEEFYIKPHPRDETDYFKEVFPNNKIINAKVPIEFFAYQEKFRINKAVVVSKSILSKVKNYIEETIMIEWGCLSNHHIIIRLYTLLSIVNKLSYSNIFNIINIESHLINMFFQNAIEFNTFNYTQQNTTDLELYEIKENEFNVFGDITKYNKNVIIEKIKNSTEETIICFMDNNSLLECNDTFVREIIKYLIPIEIKKEQKAEYISCDLDTEFIYIYCKKQEIREKLLNFSSVRNFKHTGIEITINTNVENVKINLLNINLISKINALQQNLNKAKEENENYSQEIIDINQKYVALTNNLNKIFEKYDSRIDNLVDKSQLLEQNLKERSDELYKSNAEVRELKSKLELIEQSRGKKLGKLFK